MTSSLWPAGATEQSAPLASDWQLFALVGLAVALSVLGLIGFVILRWRRRTDDAEPPQFRNNVSLEIAWTAAPLAIVVALFVHTYHAEASVDALAPHPDLTIDVRGYRWGWSFAYAGGPTVGGASDGPVAGGLAEGPPELVLPLARTAQIDLTSVDVNHSMWIPDFLYKRDAIPGQINRFDLRPTKLGTYRGHCAAFCGLNHALMDFSVRVVDAQTFAHWRATASAR